MPNILTRVLGKGWNPKRFAKKEKGVWEVTPAVFFPAMIEHIQESLASGELAEELIDIIVHPEIDPCLAARRYRNWARRIPEQAWTDAMLPPELVPDSRIMARAEALECCRLWFTRALKNAERPAGISIHISNDPRFRLGVDAEFRA